MRRDCPSAELVALESLAVKIVRIADEAAARDRDVEPGLGNSCIVPNAAAGRLA